MSGPHRWIGSSTHNAWLNTQELALLDFGRDAVRSDGVASWLDDSGQPDKAHPAETWITCRMAHVHYLGGLRGIPGSDPIARRLMRGLNDVLRDGKFGGWIENESAPDGEKAAYTHAFVVLAASTGTIAGDDVAADVLQDVLAVVEERFWDEGFGRFRDTWSSDWLQLSGYRGINANMHMVEAMLAATDATGDPIYAQRALRVCDFVLQAASTNGWRIPEHFDDNWVPDLEFNRNHPADRFKPYGATVGHAFEWSRLIAQAAPISSDPARFLAGAEALFANGASDGWAPDGNPGFVYTTDWSGKPVVADRLHWVVAEAIAAAAVLFAQTSISQASKDDYADRYAEWWDYAATFVIDHEMGSWRHQLDGHNRPVSSLWEGKPDLYHAYQAVLISQLRPSTSVARAVLA